jgi:hypothetical protein
MHSPSTSRAQFRRELPSSQRVSDQTNSYSTTDHQRAGIYTGGCRRLSHGHGPTAIRRPPVVSITGSAASAAASASVAERHRGAIRHRVRCAESGVTLYQQPTAPCAVPGFSGRCTRRAMGWRLCPSSVITAEMLDRHKISIYPIAVARFRVLMSYPASA